MADAETLAARAVLAVALHYGLSARQVKNLEVVLFRVMLRHIQRDRPCDHPGGILQPH